MGRQRALWTAAMLGYGLLLAACANREASVPPVAASPRSPPRNEVYIVVQRGQTLDAVADRFNVGKADIIAINGLKPPYGLKPGSMLKVPVTAAELNPETQVDAAPASRPSPAKAATAATTTAPSGAAPARARRPARAKTSEKPKPTPPQVIPLD